MFKTLFNRNVLAKIIRPNYTQITSFYFNNQFLGTNRYYFSETPNEEKAGGIYQENLKDIHEIAKYVHNNIQYQPLVQILRYLQSFAYNSYNDPDLYKLFEKELLRHIRTMSIEEAMVTIDSFSRAPTPPTSSLTLMIEKLIIKKITTINDTQILKILRAFTNLNAGSVQLYRALYLQLMNKSITLAQRIEATFLFLVARRLPVKEMESILAVLNVATKDNIDSLKTKRDIITLMTIYYSHLIPEYKPIPKSTGKFPTKSKANSEILSMLYSAQRPNAEDQANKAPANAPQEEKLEQSKELDRSLFDKFFDLAQLSGIKRSEIVKICQFYSRYNQKSFPNDEIVVIAKELRAEFANYSPPEVNELILHLRQFSEFTDIINECLQSYIQKYLNDFSPQELCLMWKLIDLLQPSWKDQLAKEVRKILDRDLNGLELEEVLDFIHIYMKYYHSNKERGQIEDAYLEEVLLPKALALLERAQKEKEGLIFSKYLLAMNIKQPKLIEKYTDVLKKIKITSLDSYIALVQTAELLKTRYPELDFYISEGIRYITAQIESRTPTKKIDSA